MRAVASAGSDSAGGLLEVGLSLLKVAVVGRGLGVEAFGAADFGQALAGRGQFLNDRRLAAHAASASVRGGGRNQ